MKDPTQIPFVEFFKDATDFPEPFDYQKRLACGARADGESKSTWLRHGAECKSLLIDVPTGLGKTAAVVLAWLWNRCLHPSAKHRAKWPRRLVYCLPMRTLVEQTCTNVQGWLTKLKEGYASQQKAEENDLAWLAKHSPVILMGGEDLEPEHKCWDVHPEKPCILIGTQDMLLSRALNRGYGMSRYRWPMHFSLLNNDALWVMDETQLMGVGVETSAQLDAFRCRPTSNCATWWMSATLDRAQLATVDHPEPKEGWPILKLESQDLALDQVKARVKAKKPLSPAEVKLHSTKKEDYREYTNRLAELILSEHQAETLTLVVLNRVSRAQDVYERLLDAKLPANRLALVHSRFRPSERENYNRMLTASGDRIIIATQAVEAGVDISARLLITELAPWSSLVQRFGRCNRRGEFKKEARILWIDVKPKDESDDLCLPYGLTELNTARTQLRKLEDASPESLEQVRVEPEPVVRAVLRRKDLLELFDTTPDLCGNDLDISRYIREGDDTDVQVFWRNLSGQPPTLDEREPGREELCRVPVGQFRAFLAVKSKPGAYSWNPLDEKWQQVARPRAGAVYLLDATSGGYSDKLGWTGDPKDKPSAGGSLKGENDTYAGHKQTEIGRWIDLRGHTADVLLETQEMAKQLALPTDLKSVLETTALWHDVGKAHHVFQNMLIKGEEAKRKDTIWAKSERRKGRPERKGFRHELASALAWLLHGSKDDPHFDLVAYIIAAHHGKVRLSIRSLPGETPPKEKPSETRIARGICHGDKLLPVELDGLTLSEVELDLSFMEMGAGPHGLSWLARMVKLRDTLGPFQLAWLETLLRAADMRASAKEAQRE